MASNRTTRTSEDIALLYPSGLGVVDLCKTSRSETHIETDKPSQLHETHCTSGHPLDCPAPSAPARLGFALPGTENGPHAVTLAGTMPKRLVFGFAPNNINAWAVVHEKPGLENVHTLRAWLP